MNFIELKQNLKQIAQSIKESKFNFKNCQRKPAATDKEYSEKYYSIETERVKLMRFKREYRHRHIAYCLMRGTSYDKIEKPAENNKPDIEYIKKIMEETQVKDGLIDKIKSIIEKFWRKSNEKAICVS